jgi:hypothetical protein
MSTGYDWNPVEECASPPGAENDSLGAELNVTPNAYCGMAPVVWNNAPTVALGAANFSWEGWFRWSMGHDNPEGTDAWLDAIGFVIRDPSVPGAPRIIAGLEIHPNAYRVNPTYDPDPGDPTFASQIQGAAELVYPYSNWNHLAMNFNRAGNMDTYLNSTLVDTVAINNVDLGTRSFFPYIIGQGNNDHTYDPTGFYDDNWANWTTFFQNRMHCGPMAMHNRLMTQAEISESYVQKRVQNIAAVTQICWYWSNVVGNTGWYTNEANLIFCHRATLHRPLLCPEGALGTVTVTDVSGTGNNLTLPTIATYGSSSIAFDVGGVEQSGAKCQTAMYADPFWR